MNTIKGKVIVKINFKQKEKYQLTEGVTIEWQRGYNFNLREDRAASGYVIDGEGLPVGAYVLTNYLATEPSYEITNQTILTDEEKEIGFKVVSIPQDMVFCYLENGEWQPYFEYLITTRIFKEYKGVLVGIENEQIKNRLYVIKGEIEWDGVKEDLAGKVCIVTEFSDYQIIFHDTDSKEQSVIRTRDREVLAVDNTLTKDVQNGELLIGISSVNSAKLNSYGIHKN